MDKVLLCLTMVLLTVSFAVAESDLTAAIESGNIDQIKGLLASAPEGINQKDESGLAPLHVAAYSNQLEVAKYLLESGADRLGGATHGDEGDRAYKHLIKTHIYAEQRDVHQVSAELQAYMKIVKDRTPED
ncbi:MAG: ankyrin repeat domain-containing protein [Candidatus Zixiibacteriota bacterium]|nr:MAG: ankyrin repeat domain-containing protein [candidate division Zixibacteria bacterium]